MTSSILHVTVLVFLRLLAILKPLSYSEVHAKVRRLAILMIWIISITARYSIVPTQCFKIRSVYLHYMHIIFHCLHTIPVMCIALMYAKLVCVIQQKRNERKTIICKYLKFRAHADSDNRKSTLLAKRLGLFHLICYLPFLAWTQYLLIVAPDRIPFKFHNYEVITYNKL